MRAVVLVGGFGTRLRPLTLTSPKQMLPLGHRPMIEWVVGHLADHGVDEAILSVGYRPDAFIEAFPDEMCNGVRIRYAVEPEPLDTAGAIRFAAREAGIDDTFVVVNGDVLTDLDLGALVRFHRDSGAEATIHLTPVEDPSVFGVVPTDENGRVIAFIEKPPRDEAPTNRINAGTYVFEPSVLDRIPGDRRVSIEREIFPAMADEGRLYAMATDDYWLDTGTPQQFLKANLDLLGERPRHRVEGVARTASVDPSATVERSIVSDRCAIGADARVQDSVLMTGTQIGANARVTRSILGSRVVVGPDAVLDDVVIGDGWEIDAGAVLTSVRLPEPEA
ncbi:MAG TPA: NDP-sugar synthase [Acidimicrobiales bacterium]|nr:NDP-sugar synthase [Acidimicrobiales bacterium]